MKASELFTTYSIVAADADEIGVAVQTHQMSVGSIVPWLEPGVGAVATQSLVNISLGPLGLEYLRQGVTPDRIVAALESGDLESERRQFAVINAEGVAAAFTGEGCIRHASHRTGSGYSVQANMMNSDTVVDAMARAVESHHGRLSECLLVALEAAQEEEGDIRGMQSAALVIAANDPSRPSWERRFDLRVDESDEPLVELRRLVRLRRAHLMSDEGEEALRSGNVDETLKLWRRARELGPELEEVAFWQAVTLADSDPDYLEDAGAILKEALSGESQPERWLDLVDRLVQCGLLETKGLRGKLEGVL